MGFCLTGHFRTDRSMTDQVVQRSGFIKTVIPVNRMAVPKSHSKVMKLQTELLHNLTVRFPMNSIDFSFRFIVSDQHVDSIDATIRVQIAQRRNRNNDDHGGRGGTSFYLKQGVFFTEFVRCRLSWWTKQLG